MDTISVQNHLDRAIALAGSQEKLGLLAGVTQNSIYAARKRGHVSAELATKIEAATKKKVCRSQLRPDLFGRRKQSK